MAKITSHLKYMQETGVPMPEWNPPEKGEHLDDVEFKVGDIVRLKTGHSPERIVKIVTKMRSTGRFVGLHCVYLSDELAYLRNHDLMYVRHLCDSKDFVHYVKPEKEKEMNDLYQTKAEPKEYGTLLAKNSAGRLVLEIRGTTIVKDFAPDEVEIVRPYTVELYNFSTGNSMHYISVPGVLARGDLVVASNQLHRVTGIDTKSKSSSVLIGRKLLSEEIPGPEREDE